MLQLATWKIQNAISQVYIPMSYQFSPFKLFPSSLLPLTSYLIFSPYPLKISNIPMVSFIQLTTILGVDFMKQSVINRATILGEYIKKNGATVRHTAGVFNISKSTVHKDVTK